MGLLSIIRKLKKKEKECRLLLLGLDNAGKTTLLKSLLGEDTSTIEPTLGFNIKTLQYEQYQLNFWDVGGQRHIRPYWQNYFEETDGLIWVVDSSDKERLQLCKDSLHELLGEERLVGATVLVFANKQDLKGSASSEEIVDLLDLKDEKFAKRHWRVESCSAVTGEGLQHGIDWLVEDIGDRIFDPD